MCLPVPDFFNHLPDNIGLDIAKPLIGSFAGAGLAFLSNNWFQNKERQRRNKAAGYLALSVLTRQYNDFLLLRKGFYEEKQRVLKQLPAAPKWLQARPIHYYFSDGLKFNYESLTFLFESETGDLFSKLALVEQYHHDLAALTKSFNSYAEKLQEKMAAANIQDGQEFSLKLAESAIGHDLLGKTVTLLEGIDQHFQQDEHDYQDVIKNLQDIMLIRFKSKTAVEVR